MKVKYSEWDENDKKIAKYLFISDDDIQQLSLICREIVLRVEVYNAGSEAWYEGCSLPTLIKPIGLLQNENWLDSWSVFSEKERNKVRLQSLKKLQDLGLIFTEEDISLFEEGIVDSHYHISIEITGPFYEVVGSLQKKLKSFKDNKIHFDSKSGRVDYHDNTLKLKRFQKAFKLLEFIFSSPYPARGYSIEDVITMNKKHFHREKQIYDCIRILKSKLNDDDELFPIYIQDQHLVYKP